MEQRESGVDETLWVGYGDLVYASALRQMRGDAAGARDVMQTVFLVALKKARTGGLPAEKFMAGWLVKVTVFAVMEARRAARRREKHERAAGKTEVVGGRVGEVEAAEMAGVLDAALLKLGRVDREVVVRRYLRGETVAEVAAFVGMSENTAGRRIGRAVGKLRVILGRGGVGVAEAEGGVVAMLVGQAAVKAPAAVVGKIGAGNAAAVLAKQVVWRMAMMKMTAVVLVGGTVLVGSGVMVGTLLAQRGSAPVAVKSEVAAVTLPGAAPARMETAATEAATTVASAPAATRPMVEVTGVVEESSDKLVQEVLAGIEGNRKKLKTVELEGVSVWEQLDPVTKKWTERGRVEGKAVAEAEEPQRTRFDISLERTPAMPAVKDIPHHPFFKNNTEMVEASYREVWDGSKMRRLYGLPHSEVRGEISDERMLKGEEVLGADFSLQLMRAIGGNLQGNTDRYRLDPEEMKMFSLTARRVVLNGTRAAVELDLGPPKKVSGQGIQIGVMGKMQYWFDPARGYGLLGEKWMRGTAPFLDIVVDEMVEAAPGVFYPSRGRRVMAGFSMGPMNVRTMRNAFTAGHIVANRGLAADAFDLKFGEEVEVMELRGRTSEPATER